VSRKQFLGAFGYSDQTMTPRKMIVKVTAELLTIRTELIEIDHDGNLGY
jgi:hypothetical protein